MRFPRPARYAVIHLAAAHSGVAAFRSATARHQDSPWRGELAALTKEIEDDRDRLENIVQRLGVNVDSVPHRIARRGLQGLGQATRSFHWLGEPSKLYEIEKLRTAVTAKAIGWDALRTAAEHNALLDIEEFDELAARAASQLERLAKIHEDMAARVLRSH